MPKNPIAEINLYRATSRKQSLFAESAGKKNLVRIPPSRVRVYSDSRSGYIRSTTTRGLENTRFPVLATKSSCVTTGSFGHTATASYHCRLQIRKQFATTQPRQDLRNPPKPCRFVVANTTETLLLGDLETLKLSEIQWQTGGGGGDGGGSDSPAEKFIFDSPSAALIYHASELSIVEYGRNEVRVWGLQFVLISLSSGSGV